MQGCACTRGQLPVCRPQWCQIPVGTLDMSATSGRNVCGFAFFVVEIWIVVREGVFEMQ